MLFAICTDRGSPGSTTTALALAAARGLPAVVVEADPYGGDLALRLRPDGKHPLPETPTVLGISAGRATTGATPATDAHRSRHRDLWRDGTHQLTSLVRVAPGFLAAEHGASLAWPMLAAALEAQSVPVFADVGRTHTGSPSMPILGAADVVMAVCRGDMASVHHMVDRLDLLVPAVAEGRGRPPKVMSIVIAPPRQGSQIAGAIAELLAETAVGPVLRGVGWLAWDPAAVQLLEAGADPWARPLRRSALMRSARRVMWQLGLTTGLECAEPVARKRSGDIEPLVAHHAIAPDPAASPAAPSASVPPAPPRTYPAPPAFPGRPSGGPASRNGHQGPGAEGADDAGGYPWATSPSPSSQSPR